MSDVYERPLPLLKHSRHLDICSVSEWNRRTQRQEDEVSAHKEPIGYKSIYRVLFSSQNLLTLHYYL